MPDHMGSPGADGTLSFTAYLVAATGGMQRDSGFKRLLLLQRQWASSGWQRQKPGDRVAAITLLFAQDLDRKSVV